MFPVPLFLKHRNRFTCMMVLIRVAGQEGAATVSACQAEAGDASGKEFLFGLKLPGQGRCLKIASNHLNTCSGVELY